MENQNNIKLGYELLKEMCAIKTDFNAFVPQYNPITNRVAYIIFQLEQFGIDFELDMFNAEDAFDDETPLNELKTKYVNVVVKFNSTLNSNATTVFLAHHDVVNLNSDNCQDNTASVCNLLHLCQLIKIKQDNNTLENNVVICFTDAEEGGAFNTKAGSVRLGHKINKGEYGNVKFAVNLELTANGKNLWYAPYIVENTTENVVTKLKQVNINAKLYKVPPNDCIALHKQKIESVCIGTLDDDNALQIVEIGVCHTWLLCHKDKDDFSNANLEDMNNLVNNVLVNLI